jgi:hypothetical protein
MSEVGKNPNDSLPKGKPLDPKRIVSEDDAGSAAIEKEVAEERDELSDERTEGSRAI